MGIDMRRGLTNTPFCGSAFQFNTTILPSQSVSKYFDSRQLEAASIIIKVELANQDDRLCTLISVQDPLCPVKENLGEAKR